MMMMMTDDDDADDGILCRIQVQTALVPDNKNTHTGMADPRTIKIIHSIVTVAKAPPVMGSK